MNFSPVSYALYHSLQLSLISERAYFLGLESETFTSKDVSDLMRFIDTDVDFSLDIREMR